MKTTNEMKNEFLILSDMVIETVSRHFGFDDDRLPFVEFSSRKVGPAEGHYDRAANTIRMKVNSVSLWLLCHEAAHWVQYELEGKSDCIESHATKDYALQSRHKKLHDKIVEITKVYQPHAKEILC